MGGYLNNYCDLLILSRPGMGGNIRLYFLVRCRGDFSGDEKYHRDISWPENAVATMHRGGCRSILRDLRDSKGDSIFSLYVNCIEK